MTLAQLAPQNEPPALKQERLLGMIDLFAGCGGLSLGFEQAGFTPVFVNELNSDAMATYLKNRNHSLGGLHFTANEDLRCNDANTLQGKRLEKLVSDLSTINELDLKFEKNINIKLGGGSTLDVITGGPPCQGYSGIGIRRSYSVDKEALPSNHLYVTMANVISRLRPRIFLFENVRGLLNAKWRKDSNDRIFPDVLAQFRAIDGYEIRYSLVHAKDYGVPQNRPRVLLVGIRKDVLEDCDFLAPDASDDDAVSCNFLPAPVYGEFPDLIDLLSDLVDPKIQKIYNSGDFPKGTFETKNYPLPPQNDLQRILRTFPDWLPADEHRLTDHEYSKHRTDIVKKFSYMIQNHGEIPKHLVTKKFSQRLLKSRWGNSEPNITATSLPDDYVHFSQSRVLTVREWARLQTFPDWYRFAGKRTTGGIRRAGNPRAGIFDREVPKYTQIGNAVPVRLAEAVGTHFKNIINSVI